jgi:PiT family inorganic phosphate transporter
MTLDYPIIAIVGLALTFDFLNGFHDSSNIVATVISSGALPPRAALLLAAAANFSGPFLFGVAVASTIGEDLVRVQSIDIGVVVAALTAAVLWNFVTWYIGMPSSSSHALIGGMLGAAIAGDGWGVVMTGGLVKIMVALLISPPLGLLASYLVMRLTLLSVRRAPPSINTIFRRLQIATLVGLGLSHGTNDGQKTMGVITLGLVTAGLLPEFHVPTWVIAISASAIALGTSFGGWRIIRTLGGKMFRVRPIHGFASQVGGAAVIMSAALLGGPVSTTQVMSSAIMGAGAAERINMVRWTVLRDMVVAWLLTIPLSGLVAALAVLLLRSLTR